MEFRQTERMCILSIVYGPTSTVDKDISIKAISEEYNVILILEI